MTKNQKRRVGPGGNRADAERADITQQHNDSTRCGFCNSRIEDKFVEIVWKDFSYTMQLAEGDYPQQFTADTPWPTCSDCLPLFMARRIGRLVRESSERMRGGDGLAVAPGRDDVLGELAAMFNVARRHVAEVRAGGAA